MAIAKKRCGKENHQPSQSPLLYSSDFHWSMTLDTMAKKYQAIYQSAKRLPLRAFFSNGRFYTPSPFQQTANILLPANFIMSIIKHIEQALAAKYVDYIFFPDMGHGHFLIPEKFYQQQIEKIHPGTEQVILEKIISHPEVKVLYHTAEQLLVKGHDGQLLQDRFLQWRFYTRNLLGNLDLANTNTFFSAITILQNLTSKGNTVSELPGHRYYVGFNISANHQGCFPFFHQGKTYYFDFSFKDLEPEFIEADQ